MTTAPAATPARPPRPIPPRSIGAFTTRTSRGRRSPALVWRVDTAAGTPRYLSGLQRAALLWLRSSAGYGRHTATVTELGRAIGCHRGTASRTLVILRKLELIGAPRPHRGRHGGFRFWLQRPGSARAGEARNRVRWPSLSVNVATPTPFGGYLTREGMRRSWAASANDRSGGPPTDAGPRRGPLSRGPRARGRPWPPRYVDQRCHLDGGRVRLVRSASWTAPAGDVAAAYAARCPRCRVAIAASVVLAVPSRGPTSVGAIAAAAVGVDTGLEPVRPRTTPARAALAAAILPELADQGQADRLRVDHLGFRRRAVVVPPIRPAIAGGVDTPVDVVSAGAWEEALADLAIVTASRQLESPDDGP